MTLRLGVLAAVIIGCVLLAGAQPGRAEPMDAMTVLDAPVEYSADYSLTENDQTWRGTLIHAPGRERRDFATALGTQAVILRRDIDQAVVLWPQRKWYLSTSLKALAGLLGGTDTIKLDRRNDGTETVNGEHCTRYLIEGNFDGHMWITKDGILVRAVGQLRLKGRERTMATQVVRIRRGAIDADEFELPIGYHGIPVSPTLLGGGE